MAREHEKAGRALLSAMRTAQTIAFGPLLFQAARLLRDRGVLELLIEHAAEGRPAEVVASACNLSPYAATVLLEAGLAARLVERDRELFRATRAGYLFARDPLTRVNVDFVGDVCFRAAEHLGASLDSGRAEGLAELGPWETVYEGLSELGEPAHSSWLAFDHFYSDDTFPLVLPRVLAGRPKRVLDVGANTGKFTLAALGAAPDVQVTAADLPGQIALCRETMRAAGQVERVSYHPIDIRSIDAELPTGHDVIWMSQFISCFSEAEMVHVLGVARRALGPGARLFILDNLWDQQKNQVAELCLQATSLYFTCVANGKSRMYDSVTLERLIARSGLVVASREHGIGWGHSLYECVAG